MVVQPPDQRKTQTRANLELGCGLNAVGCRFVLVPYRLICRSVKGPISIMMVAGEASGDLLGAKLVAALNTTFASAQLRLFGCAGPRMRAAGVEAIVAADDLSVVGLAEIGRSLPVFLRAMRKLRNAATDRRPDVVVLIDFPEFNLRLARHLKKQECKIVYYVSPQLWAWRKYRLGFIDRYVDLLLSILPFEKTWYAEHGVHHVEFIGNPHVREIHPMVNRAELSAAVGFDPSRPIIALLPGSREREIARILPVMLGSAAIVSTSVADAVFVICASNETAAAHCRRILDTAAVGENFFLVTNRTHDVLAAAEAGAITSGTATLEAAILNLPMVVVYKTSRLNYGLLKPLIDVPHYALINLVAGERLVTELIQDDFTPRRLADELMTLLAPARNAAVRSDLQSAAERLGHGGASQRAAELILELVNPDGRSDR